MINAAPPKGQPDAAAAWIGELPVTVGAVAERERVLRAGPYASRLPVRRTPQGRNVLRWIVQLIAAEEIIKTEARQRNLQPETASSPTALDIGSALELGGVLATILASVPVAGAVRDAVTAAVDVDERDALSYYARNIDQFTIPESRQLDRVVDGHNRPWGRVVLGELPSDWESLVFSAGTDVPIPVGPDRIFIVREIHPGRTLEFQAARDGIARKLREHRRNAGFAHWMQQEQLRRVRLAPGYEHPGNPHHADATHRH